MSDVFLAPGLRTPFVRAGGAFAAKTTLQLSAPIAAEMGKRARPDFVIWGQVIPDPAATNLAREVVFEAGLDPAIPAFSTQLACSTSFVGVIQAAGMVGKGGTHLALVGGAETMSHVPLALKQEVADAIIAQFAKDPAGAAARLSALGVADFNLPRGWANARSGRSQGDHTEDTAKHFNITREAQDKLAFTSHQRAIAAFDAGFFRDLILPVEGLDHDGIARRDTSLEKLASLPLAFDRTSGRGTLTAGNSTPNTDGASSIWVGDRAGVEKFGAPAVKLVDWEMAALDFRAAGEGILMAPGRAIPRLLARHKLRFADIALFEIHEAFAAQVLANVQAASDPAYRREKAGVDWDLGEFPWERVNPNGGSLAIGHPFAATGARILSQATKELAAMPAGSRAIVSVCADGGQGTVALLERA